MRPVRPFRRSQRQHGEFGIYDKIGIGLSYFDHSHDRYGEQWGCYRASSKLYDKACKKNHVEPWYHDIGDSDESWLRHIYRDGVYTWFFWGSEDEEEGELRDHIESVFRNYYNEEEHENIHVQEDVLTPADLEKYTDEDGNVDLTYVEVRALSADSLKIDGDLNLDSIPIESLPDSLEVGGNLNLACTEIEKLPEGLRVGGDLDLCMSRITSLPDDFQVGGNLDLSCTDIESLPDNFVVNGDLNISWANIKRLPKGLKVNGTLYTEGCPIMELPDDLEVGSLINQVNMYMSWEQRKDNDLLVKSNIAVIPESVKVEKDFILSGTLLTEYPHIDIAGTLDLRYSKIEKMPDNLHVGEDLILEGTKIAELPGNLQVGRILDLEGTKIKKLPENLKVGDSLHIEYTDINELPDSLEVGGWIHVKGPWETRSTEFVKEWKERKAALQKNDEDEGICPC